MDSMTIKKKIRKFRRFLLRVLAGVLVIAIGFVAYLFIPYNTMTERKIYKSAEHVEQLTLSKATRFNWNVAYIDSNSGGTGETIKEKYDLDIELEPLDSENCSRLLFFENSKLVRIMECNNSYLFIAPVPLSETSDEMMDVFYPDTVFTVEKKEIEGNSYNQICLTPVITESAIQPTRQYDNTTKLADLPVRDLSLFDSHVFIPGVISQAMSFVYSYDDLSSSVGIDCLRYGGGHYYAAYKTVDENGFERYLFILFDDKMNVVDGLAVNTLPETKNFLKLFISRNVDAVKEADPSTLVMDNCSYHCFANEKIAVIRYTDTSTAKRIKRVSYESNPNSVLNYLIAEDIAAISTAADN